MSINVYQMVTDRIIAELEKGNIPWEWEKPWTGVQSGAISGTTGKAYSLINQMLLGKSGKWFTWNQIQANQYSREASNNFAVSGLERWPLCTHSLTIKSPLVRVQTKSVVYSPTSNFPKNTLHFIA